VNLSRRFRFRILGLCLSLAVVEAPAHAGDLIPARLRELTASTARPETWVRLRNYAQSQSDPEWSGWAYFLVGYQEYAGGRYAEGAQDLARAAQSGFALADYAALYQATALSRAGRAPDAARLLQDFPRLYPHSHLQNRALTLRAESLMSAQQAQQAVEALAGQPIIQEQPAVALLFAQACLQSHRRQEAVRAFQAVYYHFPASEQAKAAGEALERLRVQLGSEYPVPDDELKVARAEGLLDAGQYADALKVYADLLAEQPASPDVPRWRLGQARCLVRLHRSADGLQALFTPFASPELDARRMELLVQFHIQQADTQAITDDLARLAASDPKSPAYADALSAVGMFYYRQLNWQEAAGAYQRLFESFPQSERRREDYWRLGWCDYLLHDPRAAGVFSQYLASYPDSPRAPAALYWLARIQQDQGDIAEARALFALLTRRFVHSYYAPQAAARLAALRAPAGAVTGPGDSAAAPLAAAMISVVAPPVPPVGLACLAASPPAPARPALILQELDLTDVEGQFLRAALDEDHPPAELRLLLAEDYAARDNPAGALFAALHAAPDYSRLEFSDLPKEVWDFLYPRTYWSLIERQARLNNLDPYLVLGLVRQESGFNAKALSVANARGLMQLLPQTAARSTRYSRMRYAARRLYDPAYNVQAGCAYLAQLLKEFDDKPELAVAAYNAGDFRVKDWLNKSSITDPGLFLESIPISATRTYTELVLRDAAVYRELMSGTPRFAPCTAAPAQPAIATGTPASVASVAPTPGASRH